MENDRFEGQVIREERLDFGWSAHTKLGLDQRNLLPMRRRGLHVRPGRYDRLPFSIERAVHINWMILMNPRVRAKQVWTRSIRY